MPALLSFVLSVGAQAGDPCVHFERSTDAFSGVSTMAVTIEEKLLPVGVTLEVTSGVPIMTLNAREVSETIVSIPAGTAVSIKLDDGTILELSTVADATTKPYVCYWTMCTAFPFGLGLDKASAHALATSPIALVRIPLSAGPFDWTPSKRIIKRLRREMACIEPLAADGLEMAPASPM